MESPDGLGGAPCHIAVAVTVAAKGFPHINQPDGFGGHLEGLRGALQVGGIWLQVLDGL